MPTTIEHCCARGYRLPPLGRAMPAGLRAFRRVPTILVPPAVAPGRPGLGAPSSGGLPSGPPRSGPPR